MQPIELDLDKENELVFKLSIEGTRPATTKSRFLLESNDFSLVFEAKSLQGGEVSVLIPPLENIIPEGRHEGTLEVIIDDKIVFTPMKIDTDFKKSINVVAEVVTSRTRETNVTVSPVISVNRKRVDPQEKKESLIDEVAKISEDVNREEDIKPERSKPKQRTRKRPPQTQRQDSASSRRLLESKIRVIAQKKNIEISKKQIEKIVNLISKKGNNR